MSKYDMVEHPNPEQVAGLFQPARDFLVFRARCRVAAWVIMNEHNRSDTKMQRRALYFARMH